MNRSSIARYRLYNQRIAGKQFERASDIVGWLGAVQAQDFLGSLWAIGLRTTKATEADIEKAVAERTIVRTWPMRGTLHFVAAKDVRWMLELLTPRIVAGREQWLYKQMGLDEEVFTRSKKIFVDALQGGRQLKRTAMYELLEGERISTAGGRGLHLLSWLAHDGFLCFGSREGKQPTFALLEEWAPTAKAMKRDESLAELAKRYFTSHGPATVRDFVWWSGLTVADARAALEMARSHLASDTFGDQTYWLASSLPDAKEPTAPAYLLPAFDEYTVAYKDRSAVLDPVYTRQVNSGNGILSPLIVIEGQVVGTWKREIRKDGVVITANFFEKPKKSQIRAVAEATAHYSRFIGLPAVLRH